MSVRVVILLEYGGGKRKEGTGRATRAAKGGEEEHV